MKILAIDTSCDETAVAVTEDAKVLSNIIWSQASAHAKFGGVMPSLAQRMHEERIDFVIQRALENGKWQMENLDSITVTVGPGLSIALGVGVNKARQLATKYKKPLIAVNHIEGHLFSSLARPNNSKLQTTNHKLNLEFPAYGLVVSGGNTLFILIEKVGKYKVLAETQDDALGEALDKGARMLGLGYPGGAILEKMARLHNVSARQTGFQLPIPLVGQEKRQIFSYSGLKTSFYRLIQKYPPKNKQDICNLAAVFQDVAFAHIERILSYYFSNHPFTHSTNQLLLGGGVAANIELRKRLRKLCRKHNLKLHTPYSNRLYGDNAAMIGVAAYLNQNFVNPKEIDRIPNLKLA